MEFVARQHAANSTASGTAKAKDPMMQPAGPGLPPLFVWLPKLHSRKAFYILWWILAGIVAALTLLRVVRFLRARSIRRNVAALRLGAPSASTPDPMAITADRATATRRMIGTLRGAYAGYRNWAHVRVPLVLFPNHTATEYFWTAAYLGLVLGLTMWGSVYKGKMNYTRVFGLAVSMSEWGEPRAASREPHSQFPAAAPVSAAASDAVLIASVR